MKRNVIPYIICFSLIGLSSCIYKAIPLKIVESTSYFVLQLEKAELYYPKEKVLETSLGLIKNEMIQSRRDEMFAIYQRLKQADFKILYIPERISRTNTKEEVENYLLLCEVQYTLLKQGDLKVYNKLSKKFVNKIFCKIQKNKLGEKGEVFSFPDGIEFYYHLISVGE